MGVRWVASTALDLAMTTGFFRPALGAHLGDVDARGGHIFCAAPSFITTRHAHAGGVGGAAERVGGGEDDHAGRLVLAGVRSL